MEFILFSALILILIFLSWIIKKHFLKSDEDKLEEYTTQFIKNYRISDEEKFDLKLCSALNGECTRKNLRRLIAAEIKARVLESALDPKAFPPADNWFYENSKKELDNEKKQIEDTLNKEKERVKLGQEIRVFLQVENISEEWLVANPQLFLSDLAYRGYIQTPSYARNNYTKIDDLGLFELNFCIKNKQKIIDSFNTYRNKNFYS